MCGILGIVAKTPVNQLLYDGLLLLQHRGQDAAGIVTAEHKAFHMHKGPGMVRDVFRTRNMRSLSGEIGIAHWLELAAKGQKLDAETIFTAVANVHRRCRGAYAVVAMIAGYGLLAFRDPFGIRPLVFGRNQTDEGTEYLIASESVALTAFGFELMRDVLPGEAIFIDE